MKRLKILAGFFIIIFICIFVSRISASFTVTKVTTENYKARSITHNISVSGIVSQKEESAVVCPRGLLVERICVKEGTQVKEGDELIYINEESLIEKLNEIDDEIKVLRLQNDALYYNENLPSDDEAPKQKDATIDVNNIQIAEKQRERADYAALYNAGGVIYAKSQGTVIGINTKVGAVTGDDAVMTISDSEKGLEFIGTFLSEDTASVAAGDEISLGLKGGGEEACTISQVQALDDEKGYRIFADVPADKFSINENADGIIELSSVKYDCTVPLSALIQEKGKLYVLLLDVKETPLGEENVARRIEVKLLDKNESYAALSEEALSSEDDIIVDTEGFVEAGQTVRLSKGHIMFVPDGEDFSYDEIKNALKQDDIMLAFKSQPRQNIEAAMTGRNTSAEVIFMCGNMRTLFEDGAYISEDDDNGCVISEDVAENIFGSHSVEGQMLLYGDAAYTVRGVRKQPEGVIMINAPGSESTFDRIAIRLDTEKGREKTTQDFLNAHSLNMLPLRYDMYKSISWLPELVPGQWSDFDGWRENIKAARENYYITKTVSKGQVDMMFDCK